MKFVTMLANLFKTASENALPSAAEEGMSWHPEQAIGMLKHMGVGMLVIFVIIGIIIVATLLVNKIFSDKRK